MKTYVNLVCLTVASLLSCDIVASATSTDIETIFLSRGNTLVRVNADSAYLILPVRESASESKIEVLVNGERKKTLYVRLADDKIDYRVPLSLKPYSAQGEVLLNVISETDRSQTREASEFVCWDEMRLSDSFDTANTESFRPCFHHTPQYGWMNDPNGMVYKDGVWNMYYQWNPYGSKWQNMTWGHSTSTDLIHWTPENAAIEPDDLGTVFSGCAVVDSSNTAGFGAGAVVAMYTSAGVNQVQSLAYSVDGGLSFVKYQGNPVLTTPREARDPKVFWNSDINKWNLILAGALDHEMLIYTSNNLIDWHFESAFGKGYGCQDGVWECPDLIKMNVEGADMSKWVLICNINPGGPAGGSATQYFIGDFDGRTFTCDDEPSQTRWMDYGKDHYATVSWGNAPTNRHVVTGWMSNWDYANDVPTMQYRGTNTLPRELSLRRNAEGNISLSVTPSPEVYLLRGDKSHHSSRSLASPVSFPIPELCEVDMTFESSAQGALRLTFSNDENESVTLLFDSASGVFSMDRTQSGIADFSKHFPTTTTAPIHTRGGRHTLRMFIDRCSFEIFGDDGDFAMTNLVFPNEPYTTLTITSASGDVKMKSLDIYIIK